MFNPAYPFTRKLFDSLMAKEVRHFVRSTYPRGIGGTVTQAFLISHYHKGAEATRHFNAIATDIHRDIFDTNNPDDAKRLRKETEPGINCHSFSSTCTFESKTPKFLPAQIPAPAPAISSGCRKRNTSNGGICRNIPVVSEGHRNFLDS